MIQRFFKNLRKFNESSVILGRWSRTEKSVNDLKVDHANVDHCGICYLSENHTNKAKNSKNNTIYPELVNISIAKPSKHS
jgi:hypothetical protein